MNTLICATFRRLQAALFPGEPLVHPGRSLLRNSLLLALFAIASNCSSGGGGGGGGGSAVGQVCNAAIDCGPGLFCYDDPKSKLHRLCTTTCTASADSDSCINMHPNTACLVAGVCGASCGNGLACPFGAACDTDYEVCVNASRVNGGANSCEYAYDGECDEQGTCVPGTDTADCS